MARTRRRTANVRWLDVPISLKVPRSFKILKRPVNCCGKTVYLMTML
ncbi:unnamed protein product [Meloidogyne enterolobii]|uniref:Uncharacterized protein n=1 Tax=Meloidogyne enterolobii TaxID=390850 RepID=A0ACB0Y054_MELEN